VTRFLVVVGAGGLGAGTRYLISMWAGTRIGAAFPYGTLIVNILGCFLMTFLMDVSLHVSHFPSTLRLALTTGFLGGLTTYSSFNFETTTLAFEGNALRAILNVTITLVACGIFGLLGIALARAVVR